MPLHRRQPIDPIDDWRQLQLLVQFPEQLSYELLRPVVLFGLSPAERARQTGAPQSTLYRNVARFETEGMTSLFAPTREQRRQLPDELRQVIVALYAEYPALRPHQIATICEVRYGRRPSPHTVKRVLAEEPIPTSSSRRYPPDHEILDPAERRLAIIRLHSEGWTKQSIAGYLETSRETVHATLRRWIEEGVYGLDDKSHARKPGVRKVDLRTIALVRELQENPELGEFRVHAALKRLGIDLSPRTCGRILARNRRLYGLPKPTRGRREPKEMPFRARRRHQYWTVDIRYLDHGIDEERVYCISILENYSRAILASGISRRQDLTAYLKAVGGCGGGYWWHSPEDTLDKADPEILADDTRIYVTIAARMCVPELHPYNFVPSAEDFLTTVEDIESIAGEHLDLGPVREAARRYRAVAESVAASEHADVKRYNDAVLRVTRIINPALFTIQGPYEMDPALQLPVLPGLAPVRELAALDPLSDDYRFMRTQLVRQRNRIGDALRQATEMLESI